MRDFFERLTALARERMELRARRLSKKKKQRAPGRPMSAGPSVGCGTGKGGFKAGNNCAKEDGRPNLPKSFAQKGKSATAASLPASTQALAAKAAALKSMAKGAAISEARKKAAVRKKEKQERDAAEQKAAQEAYDAKRAQLLQKLRIKKANERLNVAGTPKSVKDQLDEAKASMQAKTAEASKQLTVASTPKSLKQEIEEAKLKKAGGALNVVGTPKTVRQELDELKSRLAATKEVAQQKPPHGQAAEKHLGQQHLVKKSQSDQGKLDEERDAVFGKDLRDGWKSYYGAGGDVAIKAKISLSIDKAKRLGKMGVKEEDIDDEMLLIMDPYKRYHGSLSAEEGLAEAGVPMEYRRRYALSAGMTDSWAGTSGDSNPTAVGIQYAVKDEFGVAKAYTRHLSSKDKSKGGKAAWDERVSKVRKSKAVRAVLRAQYDSTQDWFRTQGVTKVTLVRGYSSSAKINTTGEQKVSMQPASSFSMSKTIAERFADDGGPSKARHLTATVDVSRILSTARTGFGCLNEQELTILGGVIQGRVVNKPFDW